jgi:hypothetical protein
MSLILQYVDYTTQDTLLSYPEVAYKKHIHVLLIHIYTNFYYHIPFLTFY